MKYDKPKIALYNYNAFNITNALSGFKRYDKYKAIGNEKKVINELDSIKSKLEENGFEIIYSSSRWPRDIYVHDGKNLIPNYDPHIFGEGGKVIQGKDFVLLSSSIKNNLQSKDKIKYFEGKKIYFIEPMKINNKFISSNMHIDLSIGSIPYIDVLTVDSSHYEQQKSLFDRINKNHGTTVIPINIDKNKKKLFHNNYLVVNDFVLTDPNAEYLNSVLDQFNIDLQHIDVNMEGNPKNDGSIRCLTNIVEDEETENFLKDYEEVLKLATKVYMASGAKPNLAHLMKTVKK